MGLLLIICFSLQGKPFPTIKPPQHMQMLLFFISYKCLDLCKLLHRNLNQPLAPWLGQPQRSTLVFVLHPMFESQDPTTGLVRF